LGGSKLISESKIAVALLAALETAGGSGVTTRTRSAAAGAGASVEAVLALTTLRRGGMGVFYWEKM
jgi:hypothetical protein